ncbi:hypothetical protein QYE76_055811 [Lolium multiflorum]|uniref:Transposase (putative) gypsy type domain-containing protein n=1 Tax=Lolium multiflorum TaxID=4521 RepID=A0AAD8T127_LOLMU|nr:hypothetical protein QYE76_055811 [Lolium multiflorum]
MAAEDLEWERSKISNQDVNMLKRLGLMKKEDAIRFPSESYPNPPMEYRVSFVDHLIRGLSAPIHDFLRGLLFVYGIQLHQLTPILSSISPFLSRFANASLESLLTGLYGNAFYASRNGSHNATYNIGGVVICPSDVDYFDVKFPDSVQGWRKRWLYIHEESANSVEHNIVPFDGSAKIQRRSGMLKLPKKRKSDRALMSRIHQLQNTRGKELSGVQIFAYFLRIRVQPLRARKNPLWTYAGENDANRLSNDLSAKDLEKLIRRISRLNKKDLFPPLAAWNHTAPPILSPRTILLWLPFLLFPRMEKSKNKLSLPKTTKPMIKDLIRIGSQFIGYCEYASRTEEKLAEANKRADALAQKLEQSEAARKKAELVSSEAKAEADEAKAKAASVEELQKRLEDAESALNEHKAAQAAREQGILKRLKSQSRRTHNQTNQDFDLENPVNDPLLDALSYLELHGSEIREGVANANAALSTLFPYFFPKKEEPPTFLTLAKSFNSSEDLG